MGCTVAFWHLHQSSNIKLYNRVLSNPQSSTIQLIVDGQLGPLIAFSRSHFDLVKMGVLFSLLTSALHFSFLAAGASRLLYMDAWNNVLLYMVSLRVL